MDFLLNRFSSDFYQLSSFPSFAGSPSSLCFHLQKTYILTKNSSSAIIGCEKNLRNQEKNQDEGKEWWSMAKKQRFWKGFLSIALLFSLLFFTLFIVAEADHNCVGSCCTICNRIKLCRNLLESLLLCASLVLGEQMLLRFRFFRSDHTHKTGGFTLVALKVKFSD